MSKTIKNCFYQKLTFEKLMQAHYRARKHKGYKNEIIRFELNLENNIINLLQSIKNKTYHLGKYYSFTIYEPKERIIKSLPYVDRIVHQWYVEEFIKPYIFPKFIHSSYACLENRGTHKAVQKVQDNLRIFQRNHGDFWILKCDIKKFFYNINPKILFCILQRYITDRELLAFTKLLIFDQRSPNDLIGIPIGNYTSQYFANIYLNELDQYIKRTLKIHFYVRYMDDFILLAKTKEECKILKAKISQFLASHLQLELNDKSRYYPSKMGVNFCGYRIFTTHRLLRVDSKKKIKKKVKKWNVLYHQNKLDFPSTICSLSSWFGHISHCNSYHLKEKVLNSCDFLWTTTTDQLEESYLLKNLFSYQKEE